MTKHPMPPELIRIAVLALLVLVGAGCSSPDGGTDLAPDVAVGSDGGTDGQRLEGVAAEGLTAGDTVDAVPDDVAAVPWCEGFEPAPEGSDFTDPGHRLRAEGWIRGDLHMHSPYSDGEDSLATLLSLVDYLQDPTFVAYHPEYEGNGIDYLSVTDHRTLDAPTDPDWNGDTLLLIPGEEIGGPGHANGWGLTDVVMVDPEGDGTILDDWKTVQDAVHSQGGLLSMNHPFSIGLEFPWDLREHDAVEIWNTAWTLMAATYTQTDLAAWEASHGAASPAFGRASALEGIGGNMQALKLVEAQLSLGMHPAVVGGSDRHALFVPGFPTTWVKVTDKTQVGFLDGVRDRKTFVSRTPVSATVELSILRPFEGENGAPCMQRWDMGDRVPLHGEPLVVRIRAGRAQGGLVRLIRGHAVQSDQALADSPLGEVVFEAAIDGPDVTVETSLTVEKGDWIYPMVLEPLVADGLPADKAKLLPKIAKAALQTGAEDYDALVEVFWDFMDFDTVLAPQDCDPAKWDPYKLQCLPPDVTGIASYFVPDWVSRGLNVLIENGEPTAWCVGAVGSATVFEEPVP